MLPTKCVFTDQLFFVKSEGLYKIIFVYRAIDITNKFDLSVTPENFYLDFGDINVFNIVCP